MNKSMKYHSTLAFTIIAIILVILNFLFVMQVTGLAYRAFSWLNFVGIY